MILGSAWYPEHWAESRWDDDLRLMREAGCNMVRIAEFAWSRMEPEEGRFELDWLSRATARAGAHGMAVVMGTPTAAPPAWLTQRYPDTLAIDEHGRTATHGNRCHFNPASATYRRFCRRIAGEMAKRFGADQHVVGWQIDNEYNRVSYDAETREQFQQWLAARYGDLDTLNARWTLSYWSQEYTDWAQIPLAAGSHHPSLMLDFRRFITHVYRTYQREQIDAIREHAPATQWITHNFMGWFDTFDHYAVSEDLDLASWDNYVGTGHLDYLANGAVHDLTRGFKRKNFWLMETQPGWVTWTNANNALDRGEMRTMAWHAVGHGADAISYWQWRSARGGQEQYHGTLIAQDGTPRPQYDEVARLGADFAQVGDLLRDTTPEAQVAVLHAYDDRWAINSQRHHREFDPVQHLLHYYRPLRVLGYDIDVVHPLAPLDSYRLVVAPHLHLLNDALIAHLTAYVQGGGHLLLGARSGMKDDDNTLLLARQPGPLAELLGAQVEEYFALERPVPVNGPWGTGEAHTWGEWLLPLAPDAEVLFRYGASNGWLDDQPAMVTRRAGLGRCSYLGAWLDEGLMHRVAHWLVQTSELTSPFGALPENVELCRRVGADKEVFLLINHAARPCQVALPQPMRDMLTGNTHRQWIILTPRDVAVLVRAG